MSFIARKFVNHLSDKNRNVWALVVDGTGQSRSQIQERLDDILLGSDLQRKSALSKISSLQRVSDAKVTLKALHGVRSKELEGNTNSDGMHLFRFVNSGTYDVHVVHPGHEEFRSTYNVQRDLEVIPAVLYRVP